MSAPDYLFDRVTQEIRQQMDCILALTTRLATPLPAADARACVEGVTAAAESVRRMATASSDIRAALSDTLALTPGPVAFATSWTVSMIAGGIGSRDRRRTSWCPTTDRPKVRP